MVFFKELPTYDIVIMDGNKILYYEKWIKGYGFIKQTKEEYEN